MKILKRSITRQYSHLQKDIRSNVNFKRLLSLLKPLHLKNFYSRYPILGIFIILIIFTLAGFTAFASFSPNIVRKQTESTMSQIVPSITNSLESVSPTASSSQPTPTVTLPPIASQTETGNFIDGNFNSLSLSGQGVTFAKTDNSYTTSATSSWSVRLPYGDYWGTVNQISGYDIYVMLCPNCTDPRAAYSYNKLGPEHKFFFQSNSSTKYGIYIKYISQSQSGGTQSPTGSSQSNGGQSGGSQSQSAPHIDSISPSSGNYNDSVTIKGSGFGSSEGAYYVAWYYSGQEKPYSHATSWSDTEIRVNAPTFGSNLDYEVSVKSPLGNSESNKVGFHSIQGQ